MKAKLPTHCPSCQNLLMVSELTCQSCQTTVQGKYPLPIFLKLSQKEQEFILQFFLNSGSLKEMAAQLAISYPTVRNQLDDIIERIKQLNTQSHE